MVSEKKKRGRPKVGPVATAEERVSIINLKGSEDFLEFVDDIHRKTHIPKTQIFRLSFRDWCVSNGYGEPPEI